MGMRANFCAVLATVVLAISGCGGGNNSGAALDTFVKQECAMMADFNDRLQKLLHDFVINSSNQPALGDTVSAIADLLDHQRTESAKLGDPPNGEGVAGNAESEAAVESAIQQFRALAASIRTAKTEADLQAAVAKVPDIAAEMAKQAAEVLAKYPTPELKQARKAVPGCSALFGE
jgi:hypothetical protein